MKKYNFPPVFSKTDFTVCAVPVPRGYPQSQTHVGAFLNEEDRVFLTSSPFPCRKESLLYIYFKAIMRKLTRGVLFPIIPGETYENPLLYIQVDNSFCDFKLMQSRPLMEQPDPYYGLPSFNSDPDLFIEGNRIFVINRSIFRTRLTPGMNRDDYVIRHYLIQGIIDKDKFKYFSTELFYESDVLSVSPCLTKYKESYVYTNLYTNCYNDGSSFDGLKYKKGNTLKATLSSDVWYDVVVDTTNYIPWHMSLFVYKGKLYSIVCCIKRGFDHYCYQMLGVFNDNLSNLFIYEHPLTNYNSYRGSAFVSSDGIFHLYSTTVNEKIKDGNSIDGREVIYASMPFDSLLNKLNR